MGAPAVWAAPPDQVSLDLSARLQGLSDRLATPEARALSPAILIAQAGLAEVAGINGGLLGPGVPVATQEPERGGRPPVAQKLNMRLALTMLSQAYGEDDNAAIVAAQSDPGLSSLVLTEGRASLEDLQRLARDQGLLHEASGRALILKAPLVIWPGAELVLGPEDELRLSRPDGAFVVNFGGLQAHGATIASVGEVNSRIPRFTPFVATAEGGSLELRGARLFGLGFGDTPKFSGVSVLRSLIAQPTRPTRIEDSVFEGVLSVTISADTGMLLRSSQFRDARGPALVVSRTADASILSNIFSGRMPTNAIRVESGSEGGVVGGNIILGGDRAGIVVRDESSGVVVSGNIVWQRDGSGIVVTESDCGRIEGNLVIENEQKGIEMRHSRDGWVAGNRILSNENAAIWVSDQDEGALTILKGNEVAFNGAGLAGARGESILLDGNDFSEQYLQFLSGDLVPQSPHLARDMTGREPMILSTAGRSEPPPDLPACFG